LISTFEEAIELFRLAKRTRMAVRLRDDGFPELIVLWQWLGESAGVAYILTVFPPLPALRYPTVTEL